MELLRILVTLLESEVRLVTIVTVYGVDTIEVQVIDTGSGVLADVRDSLYEPFVTTKPIGEGSGLGLAVSREIMKRMGGMSEFDASYGPGAKFVLTLPVAPVIASELG